MYIKHIAQCLVFIIFCYSHSSAQKKEDTDETVYQMIEAYNNQNYKQMKKPWGFIGKLLIRKKRLKQEYYDYYKKYGPVKIDTILYQSKYSCTAQLKFENFPEKRQTFHFVFSSRSKLQGFGFGYPTFVYRKNETIQNSTLKIDPKTPLKIDSIVSLRSKKNEPYNFNGCVLVSYSDSIIYNKCYGKRDFEANLPLTDSSLFLLASCSKQFTAVAILILEEQNKLKLDDLVVKHIPNFPYPQISIENLLTHTSGLPDYFQILKKHWDKTKCASNEDVLDLLIKHKSDLHFEPNTRFMYSNTGYIVLSLLLEKVSGKSYQDFMQEMIFSPLHMDNTSVYFRRCGDSVINNYALGYQYSRNEKRYKLPENLSSYSYVSYMDSLTGDDGISSCGSDLVKWNKALKNNEIITGSSYSKATRNHQLTSGTYTNYGYGFMLLEGNNIENMVYHTGGWPGYSTMILKWVEQNKCIIILSNNAYHRFSTLAEEISSEILLQKRAK